MEDQQNNNMEPTQDNNGNSARKFSAGNRTLFIRVIVLAAVVFAVWYFFIKIPAPQEGNPGEDANLPALDAPVIDPAEIGSIVTEKRTGKDFVSNELIVEFLPSLSEQEALEIIESVGGKMIARTTARPVFYVRITEDKGDGLRTIDAVSRLESNSKIIHAELNYITEAIGETAAPTEGPTPPAPEEPASAEPQ